MLNANASAAECDPGQMLESGLQPGPRPHQVAAKIAAMLFAERRLAHV